MYAVWTWNTTDKSLDKTRFTYGTSYLVFLFWTNICRCCPLLHQEHYSSPEDKIYTKRHSSLHLHWSKQHISLAAVVNTFLLYTKTFQWGKNKTQGWRRWKSLPLLWAIKINTRAELPSTWDENGYKKLINEEVVGLMYTESYPTLNSLQSNANYETVADTTHFKEVKMHSFYMLWIRKKCFSLKFTWERQPRHLYHLEIFV